LVAFSKGSNLKVTLVVIAKDSAVTLSRLLKSTENWIDHTLILDTGSVDRTREVAAQSGARVEVLPWNDDFSAARNTALDLAAADWHLVLDADEWLIDGGEFLRKLRHTPPSFAGQVLLEDQFEVGHSGAATAANWLSRLLPGHVRYQGRVHEQPVHSLPVRRTPLRIGHDGYKPEALAAKRGRNRRLLELALQEQPGDAYLMYQLGKDASVYTEHTLADRWFRAAWPRLTLQTPWRTDLLVRWLATLKHLGRHAEGARLAETEALSSAHSPDFHFAVADLMLDWTASAPASALDLLRQAEWSWRRCLEIGEQPDQPGAVHGRGSHLAAFNLALVLEGTGRAQEAQALRRQYGLAPGRLLG
jgi:glycosyltransferase involved in cell wall biosynthesis